LNLDWRNHNQDKDLLDFMMDRFELIMICVADSIVV